MYVQCRKTIYSPILLNLINGTFREIRMWYGRCSSGCFLYHCSNTLCVCVESIYGMDVCVFCTYIHATERLFMPCGSFWPLFRLNNTHTHTLNEFTENGKRVRTMSFHFHPFPYRISHFHSLTRSRSCSLFIPIYLSHSSLSLIGRWYMLGPRLLIMSGWAVIIKR